MKLILLAVLLVAATGPSNASDVAVSVSIGQPGYYGQLDIGGYPPPQVIYRQPRVGYDSPPMYLRAAFRIAFCARVCSVTTCR